MTAELGEATSTLMSVGEGTEEFSCVYSFLLPKILTVSARPLPHSSVPLGVLELEAGVAGRTGRPRVSREALLCCCKSDGRQPQYPKTRNPCSRKAGVQSSEQTPLVQETERPSSLFPCTHRSVPVLPGGRNLVLVNSGCSFPLRLGLSSRRLRSCPSCG